MADMMTGTVVVITGASSGIGRATALAFARLGASVVVSARRAEALRSLADECGKAGGEALAVPADVTDQEALRELADRAVARFGRVDVWVNNAGVYQLGRFEDVPDRTFRRVLETNFFGVVHGARAALATFRRQGHGVLINVASVYGHVSAPYVTAYAPSKSAVRAFSECLRQELRLDGERSREIHVCTVSPSTIDTPLFGHQANHSGRPVQPAPPRYAPERVAAAVVSLARRPGRRDRVVGGIGWQLTAAHALLPPLFERVNAWYVDRFHFQDGSAPPTDGNLFEPVDSDAAVEGGWRAGSRRRGAARAVAGAVAGAAATVAMSAVMLAAQRAGFIHEQPPARITQRALAAVGWRPRSRRSRRTATTVNHLAFGAGAGALYELGRSRAPGGLRSSVPSPAAGAAWGLLVWAVSYAGWLPKLGLMPEPEDDRTSRQAAMAVAHVVYGSTLGALLGRG